MDQFLELLDIIFEIVEWFLLVAVIFGIFLVGDYFYERFTRPIPMITVCEEIK